MNTPKPEPALPDVESARALRRKADPSHDPGATRDRHADGLFVRHEDLAMDPLARFAQTYKAFDLEMGADARATVLGHSGTGNYAPAPSGVATHLKRGSAASLHNWRQHLEPSDLARIRERVEPISSVFFDSETWKLPHAG